MAPEDEARAVPTRGWAVVTGASSGLGREFALALAARGHPVLVVARRKERLDALAVELAECRTPLETLVADLSSDQGIERVLASLEGREIDLLVNNAGSATYGCFASAPPARERELVRLNVEAVVALTRAVLPGMQQCGRGGIINVASQMAFQAMPYFAVYAATKSFVLGFTEALAEELRGSGVVVTAVAPGFVATEFAATAGSERVERRFPHLQPAGVVESVLRAHERGRTSVVIVAFYVMLTAAGRLVPRVVLRRAMGRLLRPSEH